MPTNDQILLDEILAQKKAEVDPNATESDYFELFSAEQVLKDYDLSYEQIESGVVAGGRDGGIDSMYLFANGVLVEEVSDVESLKKDISLDLVLIQSKTTAGFSETPVERFCSVSNDLFDLAKPSAEIEDIYNPGLLEAIGLFKEVNRRLAARFPKLLVQYYYCSRGEAVGRNVERKTDLVKEVVANFFPQAQCHFTFVGSRGLLLLARREPQVSHVLTTKTCLTTESGDGYVCLVMLKDFFAFISDENRKLRRNIFEANVRDYQGRTAVNDEIQKSLQGDKTEDFWWLNNGVTIVAARASISGRTLTIEDPQIVNGLQTSSEIYSYVSECNTDDENRQILIRIIVPEVDTSRDRIIKATNSQTNVQAASLRATDKIHRDIEEYFVPRGLYYDRRKNFYKNQNKPRSKIIGIPHLAQAVMSVMLQEPNTARARPSSLLKEDSNYLRVFNPDFPIQVFHICAGAQLLVESVLKDPENTLDARNRNNLRFYTTMHLICSKTSAATPSAQSVARLELSSFSDVEVLASLGAVKEIYEDLGGTDTVAKGPEMVEQVKILVVNNLRRRGV